MAWVEACSGYQPEELSVDSLLLFEDTVIIFQAFENFLLGLAEIRMLCDGHQAGPTTAVDDQPV